jgi:hypothetical protein
MPVIKKLTGTDQFCSEAHRQSYQEETNRLALDRLLNPKSKAKAEAVEPRQRASTTAATAGDPVRAVAVGAGAPGNSLAQDGRGRVTHSRATAHHQFEARGVPPQNAAGVGSERNVSDSRLDNQSKPVVPAARIMPMAGPIPTDYFCLPSSGGASIRPVAEGVLVFPRAISRKNLDLRSLVTTGFDEEAGYDTCIEVEWIEEAEPIVAVSGGVALEAVDTGAPVVDHVVLKAAPKAVPSPALMPAFKVARRATAPPPAPAETYKTAAVSSNYDFEPLGDFLEMEEEDDYAIETPAAVAPPPEAAGAIAGLTFDLKPAEPGPGKVQQGFAALPCEPSSINAPALALSPLRKKLVLGPNPNAKPATPTVAPVARPAAPPVVVKPPAPVITKPAATPIVQKPVPPQKPVVTPPAPSFTVKPAAAAATAKPAAPQPATVVRPVPAATPPPKPTVTAAAKPEPVRPAASQPAPSPARPAIAARDRSAGTPSITAAATTSGTATVKERVEPVPTPKPSPVPRSEPADTHDIFPTLGMGTVNSGFWANASGVVKISIAGGVLVVSGLLGWYLTKSAPAVETASATSTAGASAAAAAMSMGGGGWATNWGQDSPTNKGKHIQLFRPSMAYTDYHIDLRGQIEKRAMGWIFRASNPKNYYVMKLEIVKPGRTPVVALVKYAVINGKEQTHTQVMLPADMPLTMDMEYRIRTDVAGNKFTTHVQEKLVDYWTDDTIKTGGAGLYSEKDERARVKSELITP